VPVGAVVAHRHGAAPREVRVRRVRAALDARQRKAVVGARAQQPMLGHHATSALIVMPNHSHLSRDHMVSHRGQRMMSRYGSAVSAAPQVPLSSVTGHGPTYTRSDLTPT